MNVYALEADLAGNFPPAAAARPQVKLSARCLLVPRAQFLRTPSRQGAQRGSSRSYVVFSVVFSRTATPLPRHCHAEPCRRRSPTSCWGLQSHLAVQEKKW